jgi:malonate-semialdehyde dehydrogenase (acetylating) / methylmalonate-semialdehyde dehydrogenase
MPPGDRVQYLFGLKQILEDNIVEIARTIGKENGKTLAEAKGELRCVIKNVEVACGIPIIERQYWPGQCYGTPSYTVST